MFRGKMLKTIGLLAYNYEYERKMNYEKDLCVCFQFYTFDDIIALSTNAFGNIETQACGTST